MSLVGSEGSAAGVKRARKRSRSGRVLFSETKKTKKQSVLGLWTASEPCICICCIYLPEYGGDVEKAGVVG